MKNSGLTIHEWHTNQVDNWDILVIKSDSSHRYYLVNNPSTKDVTILLPHNFQLCPSDEDKVRAFICRIHGPSVNRPSITRMVECSNCMDKDCIAGLLLILALLPDCLFYVKPEDIKSFMCKGDPYNKLYHLEPRSTVSLS